MLQYNYYLCWLVGTWQVWSLVIPNRTVSCLYRSLIALCGQDLWLWHVSRLGYSPMVVTSFIGADLGSICITLLALLTVNFSLPTQPFTVHVYCNCFALFLTRIHGRDVLLAFNQGTISPGSKLISARPRHSPGGVVFNSSRIRALATLVGN